MLHTYLTHMKDMLAVAEEIAKLLDPDYKKRALCPRAAKIINSLNKNGSSQKLRRHFFRPKKKKF